MWSIQAQTGDDRSNINGEETTHADATIAKKV
jgi:hypothetical protein